MEQAASETPVRVEAASASAGAGTPAAADVGPVERASLAMSLSLIGHRLQSLEDRFDKKAGDAKATPPVWLDLIKALSGGWPAFGLLFMLLFYYPVRDAINAIPEKVRSAEEIGVLGVSLKNTIRAEAEKIGALQLSETLPTLSPAAVEFMLRASRDFNSLVGFNNEGELLKTVWLPSEQTLKILEELESAKLASVQVSDHRDGTRESVEMLRNAIADFRRGHRVREEGFSSSDQIRLDLATPERTTPPRYSWHLTDLGKNAVNVILKAVSAQLAPRPSR